MALKSKEQLKEAIFYSKEKPELLFNILFPKVKDTSVESVVTISGATSLKLSATDSVTTTAPTTVVIDQYGDKIASPTLTYAIKTAVTGCSVDSSTGVLTATKDVVAGSKPIVKVTCGTKTAELEVTIVAAS